MNAMMLWQQYKEVTMNIQSIKEDLNANKKNLIIAGILCIILGIAWNVFSGNDVSNNGVGADTVRTELNTAITGQQATIDKLGEINTGLGKSANTVGTISDRITDSEGRVTQISADLTDSSAILKRDAGILESGSEILRRVRTRSEVKD